MPQNGSLTALVVVIALALATSTFAQVPLSGNVSDGSGGPLLSGTVYTVGIGFTVPSGQTLTVQPGAIVKFSSGGFVSLLGTMNINASAANPAIFTSIADDAAGGDTNGDGSATVPVPGDWNGILASSNSDASVFTGLVARYGGSSSNGMVNLSSSDLTLVDCTLDQSGGIGLDANSSSAPTVTGCTFTNNVGVAVAAVRFQDVQNFTNNTATGNGGNFIDVQVTSSISTNVVIGPANVMGGALVTNIVTIGSTGNVTINGGVVIKLRNAALFDVSGTLTCNGTAGAPVVFTSFDDDDFGGDTNGDGPSNGTPGAWNTLIFRSNSDASDLDHVVVRYAGSTSNAAIDLVGADITITNCTIEDCDTDGIDCSNSSAPTVSDCHFENNQIAISAARLQDVPGFTNNTALNNVGDYILVPSSVVSVNTTIQPQNVLGGALVNAGTVTVSSGVTLTIEAGVVTKFQNSSLYDVSGILDVNGVGGNPVVFTTITDDAFGGDTNGDGTATTPSAGAWNTVVMRGGSDASTIEGLIVRYAGSSSNGAIDLVSADVTMTDCQVQFSGSTGLDCNSSSAPTVSGCSFEDGVGTAVVGLTLDRVPGFTANTAAGNAGGDYMEIRGSTIGQATMISTANVLGSALVVTGTQTVTAPLTFDAGVIVKFTQNLFFDVRAVLTTLGTTNNRVAFTSFADDTFGGDTNLDGPSSGSPGDWNTIVFRSGAIGSSLDVTTIRFAGSSSNGAVDLLSSDISMDRCIIDSSGFSSVDLSFNSTATVTDCEFNNGQSPITGVNLSQLQGFTNNLASGNALGDHFTVSGSLTDPDTRIDDFNFPGEVLVLTSGFSVGGANSLTFGPGVTIKLSASLFLDVFGTLNVLGTGFDPVVVTVLTDDSIGGDTNLDGAASAPASGDWNRILLRNTSMGSISNLHLRFGGASTASIQVDSAAVRVRNLRVDHSFSDGVQVTAHSGAMENWVVREAGGAGIDVNGNNLQIINATVVGCAVGGVDRGIFTGCTIHNSIVWNNVGGELLGYTPSEVFNCDADGVFAGSNGNISIDPQFVDEAAGDFHLDATSPCIGAADSLLAAALVTDHNDFSRLLDDDLDGLPFADMGAFERELYVTTVTGVPRLGTTMTFGADITNGPGAFAVLIVGVLDGSTFILPYGFISVGDLATILPANTIAMGESIIAPLPADPPLAGFSFGVQAFALVNGNPSVGQLTNRYVATLFE